MINWALKGSDMTNLRARNSFSKFFFSSLVSGYVFLVNPSFSEIDLMSTHLSVAEVRLLPEVCYVRIIDGQGSVRYKEFERMYGPDLLHVHHYCYGLTYINRSFKAMPTHDRKYLLEGAVGQIDYVITHAQPNFSLLTDVYLDKARVLNMLNRTGEALTAVNKSIEINPKQNRAYLLAIDIYKGINQTDKSLALASEGLRHLPDSTALQRRYDQLGGKLPYPEPYAQPVEPVTPTEPPRQEASSVNTAARPDKSGAASDAAKEQILAPAPPSQRQPIGSPTNPWCRFCPDAVTSPDQP